MFQCHLDITFYKILCKKINNNCLLKLFEKGYTQQIKMKQINK